MIASMSALVVDSVYCVVAGQSLFFRAVSCVRATYVPQWGDKDSRSRTLGERYGDDSEGVKAQLWKHPCTTVRQISSALPWCG